MIASAGVVLVGVAGGSVISTQSRQLLRPASGEADELGADQAKESFQLRDGERWICVQAHAHKEKLAAENLRAQAYRCFMPAVLQQIRHARRTWTELRPFFPRYIFAVLDPTRQQWRPIRHTLGVSGLIMGDESPKLVPEGVVESLIDATDQLGSLDFRDGLAVGQSVRLLSGPFADLTGSLERLDANGRVAVLLEIMGGRRRVVTERTALQALPS